jgi:hypothetical protein
MAGDWIEQAPLSEGADIPIGSSSLVDSPVQLPDGRGANAAAVRLDGDRLIVINNNSVLFNQPIGSFGKLTILGTADKPDTLTVDAGMGDWMALGEEIVFDGGPGRKADAIVLRGGVQDDLFAIGSDAMAVNAMRLRFLSVEQVTMEGLAGNDRFQVSELSTRVTVSDSAVVETLDFSAAAAVTVDLSKRSAQTPLADNPNTLTLKGRIENVVGSPWNDEIRGNSAANRIDGAGGSDTLYGDNGNDFLSGGDGDDRLYGELGNDVLLGGPGNDWLSAGAGKNVLIGGDGEDTLRGSSGQEILIGGNTLYDDNQEALFAILAQWNSGSFKQRVNRLWTGFTHPTLGPLQLKDESTVLGDAARDLFFGGKGSDWFLSFANDDVRDLYPEIESYTIEDLRVPMVLGSPIRVANLVSYRFCAGYGPGGHDLLCWTTTAESGGYFCVLDLTTQEVVMKPLGALEGYPITPASDGNIYVGSSSGEIWRYGPVQQTWGVLARVWYAEADSVHHVRCLSQGRDGWLYAGSTFGERARVRTATGRVEYLPRIREPGSWYVSSCVALPDGRVAFGLGPKARIVVYDPAQEKDVGQWAPPGWRADGYVLTMSFGRQVLFATHFPSGRRGAFDTVTGKYLGDAPWPSMGSSWSTWGHSSGYGASQDFYVVPATDTIAASDGQLVQLWSPLAADQQESVPLDEFRAPDRLIAEMSYGVSSELRVVELQWSTRSVVREIPVPPVPAARRLFALGIGPDGSVYGGAYQNMHLFRYDPRSQELDDLGNHSPRWSGETYSFTVRQGELVAASYVKGGVVLYDPAKPWQSGSGQDANPRFVGSFGQYVYRPYAVAAASDGRIWGVGAAGWGTTGGGIAWLDPDSGRTESRRLPDTPWMIAELDPATLLVASEGRLRWWDPKTNRERASVSYPRGRVSDVVLLLAGPRPLIAFCDAAGLHLASLPRPGKLQIVKSFPCPVACAKMLWEGGRLIVGGPNGIAELDLSNGRWLVLSNYTTTRWAFAATSDAVYFTRGAELLSVPRPRRPLDMPK